jgi:ABC-type Na+ efflux pump permease subunit
MHVPRLTVTTPISREEFLIGKALAAFVPALVIAYAVFGCR